jgi:hypothetical protein
MSLPLSGLARLGARKWMLVACGTLAVVLPAIVLAEVRDASAGHVAAALEWRTVARATHVLLPGGGGIAASKEIRVPSPPPASSVAPPPPPPSAAPTTTAPPPSIAPPQSMPPQPRASAPRVDTPSGCNPPYTIDKSGVRIPKRWCP